MISRQELSKIIEKYTKASQDLYRCRVGIGNLTAEMDILREQMFDYTVEMDLAVSRLEEALVEIINKDEPAIPNEYFRGFEIVSEGTR